MDRFARVLRGWGFEVDYGKHAFDRVGFLAGTDDARAADLNEAFADPAVRAVVAHTLPEPGPSPRVLEKAGFAFAGDVIEHGRAAWRFRILDGALPA